MPEKDYVTSKFGRRVHYSGKLDFEDFKDNIKTWFDEKQFTLTEKEYKVKDRPPQKKIEITWQGERKQDDYAKFHLDIEVLINATKIQGNQLHADIDARIIAYVELDYMKKFDKPGGKFMQSIYHDYIHNDKIEEYEVKLIQEVKEILDSIKEMLELNR